MVSKVQQSSNQDYNLPSMGISQIKKRIEELKKDLAELRRKRSNENGISNLVTLESLQPPAKKSKDVGVSAKDIRQRYRAEVGFRTENPGSGLANNAAKKLSNRPNDRLELSKEHENKLFCVSLNSLALKGKQFKIFILDQGDSRILYSLYLQKCLFVIFWISDCMEHYFRLNLGIHVNFEISRGGYISDFLHGSFLKFRFFIS